MTPAATLSDFFASSGSPDSRAGAHGHVSFPAHRTCCCCFQSTTAARLVASCARRRWPQLVHRRCTRCCGPGLAELSSAWHPPPARAHVSALRVLAIVPTRVHSPVGQGHRSWALPAASGSSVCPSPDFWASSPVRRPFEPCFPPPRTRPAAAPARLHAAFPGPAPATTLTPALAAQRRPFRPV